MAEDIPAPPPPRFVTALFAPGDPNSSNRPPTKERVCTIVLDWPLEYEGTVHREIVVRRLIAAEVAKFQEEVAKAVPDSSFVWPIYRTAAGEPLPPGLLDALDDDDRLRLEKAAVDFLPLRFRGGAKNASDPAPGEPTA